MCLFTPSVMARIPRTYDFSDDNGGRADTAADVSDFMLTALNLAAQVSPVPYLSEASGLALGILASVQGAKSNKESFNRLASDACGLVYSVLVIYQSQEQNGKELSLDLVNNLRNLLDTLQAIDNFARKKTRRNVVMRIIAQKSEFETIREYRERLRQALDVFGLQSNITIRQTVTQMSERQDELYAVLREREAKEKAKPTSQPGADRTVSTPAIAAPPQERDLSNKAQSMPNLAPAPVIPAEVKPPSPVKAPYYAYYTAPSTTSGSFHNMSTGSGGMITNVNGDQINRNGWKQDNRTNYGNNTTITTTNSHNDNSVRNVNNRRNYHGPRHR